ncbi:MAG: alanine racemase [Gammaproteobacteria bacterium]|nr:alanine racemase [Gammaproteobacteria bacterium]NND36716.1 alanine racemase [Gammaproteobacteria bacterium]
MASPAVARIRPAALRNNLDRARAAAPGCPVLAVIKADAYGHGMEQVARILDSSDAFAVARFAEAVALRRCTDKEIVVMSESLRQDDMAIARDHNLQVVVHDRSQIDLLATLRAGAPLTVWLKIDSGMGRLGIAPADTAEAIVRLRDCKGVDGEPVLMTHFASADELDNTATAEQLKCFGDAIGDWQGDVSIANSAGILGWPAALSSGGPLRYSGRNWIRPGLMLYGVSPFAGQAPADARLQPAMAFEASLIAIREIPRGARVGYGGEWQAERDSRIGVVNVGYADGYPWRMPGGTPVGIAGTHAPVVGRISMDMISVDLTDLPAARTGDTVTLWGDRPHVAELAGRAGTSAYELLTGVGNRVERIVEAGN